MCAVKAHPTTPTSSFTLSPYASSTSRKHHSHSLLFASTPPPPQEGACHCCQKHLVPDQQQGHRRGAPSPTVPPDARAAMSFFPWRTRASSKAYFVMGCAPSMLEPSSPGVVRGKHRRCCRLQQALDPTRGGGVGFAPYFAPRGTDATGGQWRRQEMKAGYSSKYIFLL